ncbi:hypothetical protein GWI34_14625 [Actinomadura sp. DSM 109109]|nr:hypothetical protein [Actinomadura lepetitiana]
MFDAMLLNHFARADRIDVLRDLHIDRICYTTHVVREELRAGIGSSTTLENLLTLDWLDVKRLDTLEQIATFATWVRRLGAGPRNVGEASVFATAELWDAIALTDDQDAVRVGRKYELEVHGTIWLLSVACKSGKLTEVNVSNLIDALEHTGMRLPCSGSEYGDWARQHRLLP